MKTTLTNQNEIVKAKLFFYFAMATFIAATFFFSMGALAQCLCSSGGYTQSRFQNQILSQNVQYTQNASAKFDGTMKNVGMDIWVPIGDNCSKRPLIIWVHGGGFAINDKTAPDVVAMCDSFSRKGFICATIDYRDGYWGTSGPVGQNSTDPTPYDTHEFTRADYRAMQDAKCCVRYFKSNALQYGIDTNNIFMGGTSAGGWTSLMVAFLDKSSEKFSDCLQQSNALGMYSRPDLGSIDGTGGWNNVSSRVRGIVSIFGAVPDTSIIDSPNEPAAIFFHEYGDPVVNFYYGAPFQGQYQNFNSYWGDYYVNMQLQKKGGTHKAFWINGSQHNLYPYRGMVTLETSKFLDSLICTSNATAVNEFQVSSSTFQVYPNPSSGVFQLETSNLKLETLKIQVYNAIGEMVLSETVNQQKSTINLSDRSNGVYFIKANSEAGVLTEKVLLSR
jgi:hypothetical protein